MSAGEPAAALDDADARRIAEYLDLRTALPERADLLFVFGTRSPEPARLAADAWLRGMAPRVIVTGGANRYTGIVEAHAHRDELLRLGVPPEAIVVEDTSTNTGENVAWALPLLAARLDLATLRTVIAVTKWYHARRALMALRRHLPAGVRYAALAYEPPDVRRAGWHRSAEGQRAVLKERRAIPDYLARGWLAEIRPDGGYYV